MNDKIEAARRLSAEALQPSLGHADVDQALMKRLSDEGLTSWWIPKEFGGGGLSMQEGYQVVEELAYGNAGVAFTGFVSTIASVPLLYFGSPKLRDEFLAPLCQGQFAATAGSEHNAGSELLRVSTKAAKDGDQFSISGVKAFSTNAKFAHFTLVICASKTEDQEYYAIVVPRETAGFEICKRWPMMGLRNSGTYELEFKDCRVPHSHLLEGHGLRLLEVGLNYSRVLFGALVIGIARRIRDCCLCYADSKPIKGGKLFDNDVFVAKLGEMELKIETMRAVVERAAAALDALANQPSAQSAIYRAGTLKEVLVAKQTCGRLGWEIASEGSLTFGGFGYSEDSEIPTLLRDIRIGSLVEGGDDVSRELVYRRFVVPSFRRWRTKYPREYRTHSPLQPVES